MRWKLIRSALTRRRHQEGQQDGFLVRLARDRKGNVLALSAAAVLPLLGMVGSGVDIGRAYLLKTRLQQACDAGVLAARKSMTGNALNGDTNASARGRDFFNINLKNDQYGVQNVTFGMADVMGSNGGTPVATGRIHGTAGADVPSTIMKLFGVETLPITAACDAELNLANNDIMFVLDVTGSMACTPGRPNDSTSNGCDTYVVYNTRQQSDGTPFTTEESGSRISALRSAVDSFYVTVNNNLAPGARLRLGFVPYSSGVNIGGILPSGTMNTSPVSYASRLANFRTPVWTPATPVNNGTATTETLGYNVTRSQCTDYGNNTGFSQTSAQGGKTFAGGANADPAFNPADVVGGTQPATKTYTYYTFKSWTDARNSASTGACSRYAQPQQSVFSQTAWQFTDFTYTDVPLSTSAYMGGGVNFVWDVPAGARLSVAGYPVTSSDTQRSLSPLALAQAVANNTASGMTVNASAWTAQCVEERLTDRDSIIGGATTPATQWRPSWPDIVVRRDGPAAATTTASGSGNYTKPDTSVNGYLSTAYSCPKAAQGLQVMTRSQVNAYLSANNDFVAHGYTYHDIGMVWATRLMSTRGVFSATHTPAGNGRATMRHIIFMTDGDMKPTVNAYGQFGIESVNRRMVPSGQTLNDSTLQAAHNARFAAACTAATQSEGISVWVVAFGQTLTPQLTACASNPSQAYQANNAQQLNNAFSAIASKVAELRLTA